VHERSGQSQQSDKAPTTPAQANAEQTQKLTTSERRSSEPQASRVPETSRTAVDQSGGITVTVQQQEPKKRPLGKVFGALGALITALLGFFLGVASTQVSYYVERANDCVDALEQYNIGVAANFIMAWTAERHPEAFPPEQESTAVSKYQAQVDGPYNKALATCPLDLSKDKEYLDENRRKDFVANYSKMDKCMSKSGAGCSEDDVNSLAPVVTSSAQALVKDAQQVPGWGVVRRAGYVLTHWY
jgi:hypothetical protein